MRLTRYSDLPLRAKVTLLLASTAAFAVVVASVVFVTGDVRQLRSSMASGVSSLADVIGANTAAAIVSGDQAAAEDVLASLEREPSVVRACIYDESGGVFATYGTDQGPAWPGARPAGAVFRHGHLEVSSTILEGGEPVGSVLLYASTKELNDRVTMAVLGALAAIGGALGLALILASRLQRFVSEPILRLAGAAARVSLGGDYTVRVEKQGNDEIGLLCDGFNEMLEQIRRRDRALELLAAIEQTGDAIVIADSDGTIEYVNPSFERMTGYSREETVGRNPRVLQTGRQGEDFYRELAQRLKSGEVWKGQFASRRKDGTPYLEEATISPVLDASGTVVKHVATRRDVTRERQLEEQFRQSQKMEAVGQLAGGIAHDLNNVLTVINGHAELIIERTKAADAPVRKSANEILQSGRRAAALVRQVLAFGRRQMLQPRIVDLNSVVSGMKDVLQSLLTERIEMVLDLDPDAGFIEADPNQMQEVVLNLAVNARDAMERGGRLTVQTRNGAPEAGCAALEPDVRRAPHVVLSVTDTGAGMTDDVKAHLFEPFFTTKEATKGLGLGLATVYGIVKQSGGEIDVRTAPGEGTTFRVCFPCAGDRRAGRATDSTAERETQGTETVLVIEDEEPVREFLGSVLKGLGYTVLEARDGLEALQTAGEHAGPVHLAIADLATPAMGGSELANRLVRIRPGAQMLYISGYSNGHGPSGHPVAHGMHVLERPFSAETLARKVREVLADGNPRVAAA